MKKYITLLLTLILCLSLCACGITDIVGGKDDFTAENIYIEYNENNGLTYLVFPNSKVFAECVSKVEITKDNWHEYFEDYEYTEHVVKKNAFGDIEEEYDLLHIGFGVRRDILIKVDTVSFKFDGMTEYSISNAGMSKSTYNVLKANQADYTVYNYATNEPEQEKQLKDDQVKPHYLLELKYHERIERVHYGDHNCLDAIGELYIINLPEGVYHGEDIDQLTWASGGGAGFGVGNVKSICDRY